MTDYNAKEAKEKFEQTYLFDHFEELVYEKANQFNYYIHSLFITGRGQQKKVTIHVGEDCDLDELGKTSAGHFGDIEYEIIPQKELPQGNSSINSGDGIKLGDSDEIGSLGGVFKKANSDALFGLSNNHVIAHCNQARKGDPIKDANGNRIGQLHSFIQLNDSGHTPNFNFMDAAIFQLDPNLIGNWDPAIPTGAAKAQVGWQVYKRGLTTGIKKGTVVGVNGTSRVNLRGQVYLFKDLIAIKGLDGENFTEPGDSGSLVMTMNHKIVAIAFAKFQDFSYACPIQYINGFNLRF